MPSRNHRSMRTEVRAVAPEAARQDVVFNWLRVVIMQAISAADKLSPTAARALMIGTGAPSISWEQPEIHEGRFPPQYEQSLERIADRK